MPVMLTVKEAAAYKRVAPSTVARAISEGRLPATAHTRPGKVRGTWRINRAALDAWTPLTDRSAPRMSAKRAEEARLAAIDAGTGCLARYGGRTLDDFLREKREDLELEEYRSPANG